VSGRKWVWGVLAAAVVALVVVVLLVARSDDDSDDGTPVSAGSSSTTEPETTTTTVVDLATAVWPRVGTTQRFTDPLAVTRSYAVDFLGMPDPALGEYQGGDARSGEVTIRSRDGGPTTTVFVRKLDTSGAWWVIGSSTPNIELTSPGALDRISSPVRLMGRSTAFEAQVNVRVYADGRDEPIADTYFMGGANGEMGPFDTTVAFTATGAPNGTIVLFTISARDGTTAEASTLRVRFTG
jgi:hypothetical protein